MEDKLAYRYFAFISYSSKDIKTVEKLQKRIETYRLPTVLRNELEAASGKKYPKRLYPLFRDMTDLSIDLLGKSILRELEDSRFLIVICSPESAQSVWVNQEVENYILMGRYERIIPYIIDGIPNSGDPATESFPPILRKNREFISYSHLTPEENAERQAKLHALLDPVKDELKGVSLSGEGPRNARLKVIAKMLDVSPETLIRRDKQRRKNNIILASSIVTFFMILFTCLGLWTWDHYFRVHVGYFADYVEYWGVPRGIFPLSPEQRAHREGCYKIYTQNQKVIGLEHVNSADTPIPIENPEFRDRPMIADYPIYKEGRLVQRDTLDNNGKVVMSYFYSGDQMQKVEFKSMASDNTTSSTVLSNITSLTNCPLHPFQGGKRGEIGSMRLFRDAEGRVIEQRFQKGSYDIPTTDEQGIAGFRYKLDDLGRVVEKIYLDQNGVPCPDKQGVASRKNWYDEKGNLVVAKYFDANGKLTLNELGWMLCIDIFDDYGNCIEEKYVDASGALCLNIFGNAGVKNKYDERGNQIERAFFGVDGKPCLIKDGPAKVTWKYDERGNITEKAYFGVDSHPCPCVYGPAKVTMKYDERATQIERAFFGVDGKPCLIKDGPAKVTWKYDERGNITEEAYFGVDGKTCLSVDGYAKVTSKVDERGNLTEVACFGVNDLPCLSNEKFAKFTSKYDEQGNITEEAYFGVDGKPCLNVDGYAKVTSKYDERGNEKEIAYFGIDDKPCVNYEGIAGSKSQYDAKNQEIRREFFDTDGKPCVLGGDDPYTGWEKSYYEDGTKAKQTWFYTIKPYRNVLGKYVEEYNERGKCTSYYYLDMNDQPCICDKGYAKSVLNYNEQREFTKTTYYDIHGKETPLYVTVKEVLPDSNSEKLGLQNRDCFILYDGQPVDSALSLIGKRFEETGDDPHELVVLRNKEFVVIQISPVELDCKFESRALPEE